ncbi:hypothetical protein I4U23_004944 [Adineta vaga]|nr:hypothetical protein I4U23_004944 [Adineta vaga]
MKGLVHFVMKTIQSDTPWIEVNEAENHGFTPIQANENTIFEAFPSESSTSPKNSDDIADSLDDITQDIVPLPTEQVGSSVPVVDPTINDDRMSILWDLIYTFQRIWSYLLIVLGTVGHVLNVYVFTRPTLRSNPCARYFLAATIGGIFCTYVNTLLRLLQSIYPNYNPFGYSTASCKILTFIAYCFRCNTSWFIVLASIDRFLCSSTSRNVREWSNLRMTYRAILFVIVVVGLFYLYVPIQFENIQTNFKCPGAQTTYPLFNGIWNLLIFSLGPSLFMLIFGLLTIRHVQQVVRRARTDNIQLQTSNECVAPIQNRLAHRKTTDRQLTRMMLAQCLYFGLLSTPISVSYLYVAVRINVISDALQTAKDILFINISGLLSITAACTSFYLFTLSSPLFRRELANLFRCQRRTNMVTTDNVIRPSKRD